MEHVSRQELLVVLDNFERAATAIKPESEREEKINSSYQVERGVGARQRLSAAAAIR